jgi:uncharacterized protein (UPF0332 family)
MKPESKNYLEKAQQELDRAQRASQAQLPDLAAREAYLAALAATRAIIFELEEVVTKTHIGASKKFHEILAHRQLIPDELTTVLDDDRRIKTVVDYDFGELPSTEIAADYLVRVRVFVGAIEGLLNSNRV